MACPMGFTMEDLERRLQDDAERDILDEKYPDSKPFDTLAQPNELRRLTKEAIYLTGGQYALLLQWLHPGLARGTFEHSDLEHRLLERVQSTIRFLSACIFGTELEKRAIFHLIHKENALVVGEGYSADDPELHKWTAATLFMSLKMVHETFFRKLERREEERLLKEAAIYGTSLRMPTDWWPKTLEEFYKYWDQNVETLEITEWARKLSKQLMYPKNIPFYLKPASPVTRLLTAEWLPPRLQQEYGLRNTALQRGTYKALVKYVHLTYPLFPKVIRHREHKKGMKDMRAAVQKIDDTKTLDVFKTTMLPEDHPVPHQI